MRGPGSGEEEGTAEGGGEREEGGGGRGGGRGVIAVLDDGHEMDQCSCDLVKVITGAWLSPRFFFIFRTHSHSLRYHSISQAGRSQRTTLDAVTTVNHVRTVVPFWGQNTQNLSGLSPQWTAVPKGSTLPVVRRVRSMSGSPKTLPTPQLIAPRASHVRFPEIDHVLFRSSKSTPGYPHFHTLPIDKISFLISRFFTT